VNSIRAPTKAFVEADMRSGVIAGTAAIGLALALSAAAVAQQSAADEHFARARAAAGGTSPTSSTLHAVYPTRGRDNPGAAGGRDCVGPPARATWHSEPVKVFDNLYFIGQTEYSAWAIRHRTGSS